MYTLVEEQMHFVSGGMGSKGKSSSGKGSSSVNRADKVNRDGTKNMSIGQTISHIAGNSGISFQGGTSGWGISATPNCGSCHDPARNSKNYKK